MAYTQPVEPAAPTALKTTAVAAYLKREYSHRAATIMLVCGQGILTFYPLDFSTLKTFHGNLMECLVPRPITKAKDVDPQQSTLKIRTLGARYVLL